MRPSQFDKLRGETAARAADAPLQAIDLRQLDELRAILGEGKLRDLLHLAHAELTQRPSAIRRLAEYGHFATLRSVAHSLKGSLGSLALAGVAHAAEAVELAIPGTGLDLALTRLEAEAARAQLALAPLLTALPGASDR